MKKFKPLSMLGVLVAAGLMLAGCAAVPNSAAPKETEGHQAQESAMESKTAEESMGMDETEEESTMALLDSESGYPVEFAKYRAGTETDQELFDRLGEMSYEVTQNAYTEPKFQNIYDNFWGAGIYVDVVNGDPLFCSRDKYDSGWGWPAFTKPISEDLIVNKEDLSHGLNRTEVRSSGANSHLGHVFNDGPADRGGLHYCINSASLKFIPMDQMEEMGYGDYLYLFEKEEESK